MVQCKTVGVDRFCLICIICFLEVIKNDFAAELNQFLATFYEIQYKDTSYITYLFIPKEGVEKSSEELAKDKALVTRYEGTE
jgi:hypothetical protein